MKFSVEWRREKGELYEHRHAVTAVVECPRCGDNVDCESETEEWHQKRGKWHHSQYGPGAGECCGLLIVDTFEGAAAYELPAEAEAP